MVIVWLYLIGGTEDAPGKCGEMKMTWAELEIICTYIKRLSFIGITIFPVLLMKLSRNANISNAIMQLGVAFEEPVHSLLS